MQQGSCLRIYLTESDTIDGKPAMEAILELCKQADLHGVSVVRGIEGMGESGVHSVAFLSLASELPLLVEVVDNQKKIQHAMDIIRPKLGNRLMATWPVSISRGQE